MNNAKGDLPNGIFILYVYVDNLRMNDAEEDLSYDIFIYKDNL
jgi:hypothetical protein